MLYLITLSQNIPDGKKTGCNYPALLAWNELEIDIHEKNLENYPNVYSCLT